MELKCCRERETTHEPCSSNRTFMELKFDAFEKKMEQMAVLIVPLWN